jgi:hypothetical protein
MLKFIWYVLNWVPAMDCHNHFISVIFMVVLPSRAPNNLFSCLTFDLILFHYFRKHWAVALQVEGISCSSPVVVDHSKTISIVDARWRSTPPPCALLLEPPWSSDQKPRGVWGALPQSSWRPRLIAAAALHQGASAIGCYFLFLFM